MADTVTIDRCQFDTLLRSNGSSTSGPVTASSTLPNSENQSDVGGLKSRHAPPGIFPRNAVPFRVQEEAPSTHDPFESEKRQWLGRNDKRTILLSNLPERAVHKDIIAVIQGGLLLDLFIRSGDRTANVSFADGNAAQDFFAHTKRNDLYILGKRVDVRWNERQFILPNHVARKLAAGASRNLVLHNVPITITEQQLREDLEHIHNLVVVDVFFKHLDLHVSLNSVHNALYARTCMMSRAAYKGIKIDFDEDQCALPLPLPQRFPKKKDLQAQAKHAMPVVNRFHLLDMEDPGNGSEEDEEVDMDHLSGIARHLDLKGPIIAT
ncbi:MAG: hypothetical protein M4579_007025 [Chaenotheca gracillima]|nr:MAG: hypothetical protein M4579_007025 [Chaenotheca gracillima]